MFGSSLRVGCGFSIQPTNRHLTRNQLKTPKRFVNIRLKVLKAFRDPSNPGNPTATKFRSQLVRKFKSTLTLVIVKESFTETMLNNLMRRYD